MTPYLVTGRLLLKPLVAEDAPAVQAQFPDWRIVEHPGAAVPWPYPANGAAVWMRDLVLPAMARGTTWHWSLRLKRDPARRVGVISLRDTEGDNRGFWLNPAFWRQGLMSAACEAVTAFWFMDLERPMLRVPKAVANTGSRRISEKSRMRVIRQGERACVSGPLPTEIRSITREEWLARGGA